MSYDINFWFPKAGQTFSEWIESFDGSYSPDVQQRLGIAHHDVRTRVQAVVPEAEIHEDMDGLAIDEDASGISFGYSPQGVSLSCPYRAGSGSSRIPLMYDIATTVASLTGLQAWDPQVDAVARGSNLDIAVEAYERTAQFAKSLLSSPDS